MRPKTNKWSGDSFPTSTWCVPSSENNSVLTASEVAITSPPVTALNSSPSFTKRAERVPPSAHFAHHFPERERSTLPQYYSMSKQLQPATPLFAMSSPSRNTHRPHRRCVLAWLVVLGSVSTGTLAFVSVRHAPSSLQHLPNPLRASTLDKAEATTGTQAARESKQQQATARAHEEGRCRYFRCDPRLEDFSDDVPPPLEPI